MNNSTLIGLDVGEVRVGVAVARLDVRLPQPLVTLPRDDSTLGMVGRLVGQHQAVGVVVGWPRGMDGQTTAQTLAAESFANELRTSLTVPVYLQDEALTSRKAEAELASRRRPYDKAEVDALAATYILSDYLESMPSVMDGAANV